MTRTGWTFGLIGALIGGVVAVVAAAGLHATWTVAQAAMAQPPRERIVYMAAVEPKGEANVESEPFPTTPLPGGGGYALKPPDAAGRWEVETYRWAPGTIVAYQGEPLRLEILGVNGREHVVRIEGYNVAGTVTRGSLTRLTFTPDRPGIFPIICHIHRPSMQADLVVLAR